MSTSNLRGIGFMLAGAGTFVLNDSLMKIALADLPPYQVLFMRGVSGTVCATAVLAVTGDLKRLARGLQLWVIVRALLEVVAILTYILALAHAPIGDATAIFQITPLLVIVGMIVIHRETTDARRLILVVTGFAGALLVAQPGFGTTSPYVLFAFATALFAALRDLAGRRVSPDIPVLVASFTTIVLVMLSAALAATFNGEWAWPKPRHAGLLACAGFLMMLGHMFVFLAYRHARAQAVAPFYYAFMIWAVALGFVIFGDIPNGYALSGMILILASGLGVAFLERDATAKASVNVPLDPRAE